LNKLINKPIESLTGLFDPMFVHPLAKGALGWKIQSDLGTIEELEESKKQFIVSILHEFPSPFLYFPEDPFIVNSGGLWRRTLHGTWIVPPDVNVSLMYNYIREGKWFLYISNIEQKFPVMDYGDYGLLQTFMKERSILLLLNAHNDNDPWIFTVNPSLVLPGKSS
jgi:hypothetical protein